MKEIWKDIKDWEGCYQISNYGRLKSLERFIYGRWGKMKKKEIILKTTNNKGRYCTIKLHKNKKIIRTSIHRLVLGAFSPNPNYHPICNHKDGDKTNNHISNLEWCSHSENHFHAHRTGLSSSKKGEDSLSSKLTEKQVL